MFCFFAEMSYFFAEDFSIFSLVPSMFVTAHWRLFSMVSLKSLWDNSNVPLILLLTSRIFFFIQFEIFLALVMTSDFGLELGHFHIMLWDWILFKPLVLVGFFWRCSGREGVKGGRSPDFPPLTPKESRFLYFFAQAKDPTLASSNPSCCNDNAGSLTCCTTRELPKVGFW